MIIIIDVGDILKFPGKLKTVISPSDVTWPTSSQ